MALGSNYSPAILSAQAKASKIFTPASPIDAVSLFRGRSAQIQMLIETVSQIGQHAIVYGERGVGKTSLVSVLREIVGESVLSTFHFAHVNCDIEDTFTSLWRKIFLELQVDDRGRVSAIRQPHLETRTLLADRLGDTISPDDIRRLCRLVDGHLVVIIDEFDQLSGNLDTIRLIANTIKTLSDRRSEVTLILVGIADTVSQLVTEYESVERNLVQIHMPRMSGDEVELIIREGLTALGFAIDDENLSYVCSIAQGLPASAHRIGLQIAHHMIKSQSFRVSRADIDASLGSVIDRMPQSHLIDWRKATQSSKNDTLFEDVLISAALARRDEQGWFQFSDILEPLKVVTDGLPHRPLTYSQHLHRMATQRGMVLERVKFDEHWQFRFRSPSFQSYVLMRSLSSGRLMRSALSQFRDNIPAESGLV
ncbi:MAG: ATP-binding protein [Chloroflexi bacterium]|nr:ATP-binding protein [Chloroflexota bacterium]MDA1219888.1 ATP-binding protein [Chloroflexota bacterium]